jgi:hypothetical protein
MKKLDSQDSIITLYIVKEQNYISQTVKYDEINISTK